MEFPRNFSKGLEDALDTFMEYGCLPSIGLFVILFSGLMIYGCTQEVNGRKEFMQQCMQDRKEYECYAMWRRAVPVPIVIPVR